MSERRLHSLNGENVVYETGKDSSVLATRERKWERVKERGKGREKESAGKDRKRAQ